MQKGKTNQQQKRPCRHAPGTGSVAVVGLGNLSRRDDGVALKVIEQLQSTRPAKNVCYFPLGTYNNLIGQCLPGHDYALIIDSTDSGSRPGTLCTIDLLAATGDLVPPRTHASHGLSFLDELALIPRDQLPKSVLFVGIEAADNGYGEELSTDISSCIPEVAEYVLTLIGESRKNAVSANA